jgi:microcystin-dependent protein
MIGQSSSSPPSGWLLCDGGDFITSDYPELALRLPDGKLPDLRNYVLVGAGDLYNSGTPYGSLTHTLAVEEMPSHQHFGPGTTNSTSELGYGQSDKAGYIGMAIAGNCYLYGSTWAGGAGANQIGINGGSYNQYTYGNESQNNSFSLLQPSYAVNYYIFAGSEVVSASEEKGDV